MKKEYFFYIVFGLLIIGSVAFAQGISDVKYPVAELGNCKSEAGCKTYCDKPENADACVNFAEKNNLMSKEEVATAKKFLAAGAKGPGGCKGKEECGQYCNDTSHIDECISFAEKNGLMSGQELEEAKKVQSAIARGVKPPPCGNKKACDAYCEESEHMEECITFGVEAGFIQGKEAEDAQKMLQAIKRGIKPPPCKGKQACDEYCNQPDNMETCINFAMEAGFMSEQEKADSQKMLQALKKGVKPPPCKGKEECDVYCQQDEHFEECTNFAVAAGFMSEKDAEMARKTGGKGPGGCKGKEECEAFCNNPDNQETCFNFAKDNGMIPEEELKKMEEGKEQMKQALGQAPSEVIDCLNTELGANMVEKMRNGVMPSRDVGDKMQTCFQKMGPPQGEGNQMPPCEGEDCKKFQPGPGAINPGGQMMPQQAGPGGCKTPEECQSFCQNNPDQCKNFGPGQGDQQAPPIGPNDRGFIEGKKFCEGPDCNYDGPPPCQGENCQAGPMPGQPGQEFREGQQPPAPGEQPPPPPPTSFIINTDSFVGSLIYAAFKFFANAR